MSHQFIKLFAAAALIAAMPAAARAQTVVFSTSSPVVVTALRIDSQYAPLTAGGYAAQTGLFAVNQSPGSIALGFVNRSSVPATTVTFVVSAGRESRRVVDKGVFSPGVLIEHKFAGFDGFGAFADAMCEVAEVRFADGSSWHTPDTGVAALADQRAEL